MWVDLAERTPEVDRLLAETSRSTRLPSRISGRSTDPKVESFGTYLHILVHGAKRGALPTQIVTWTLSIVLERPS